MVPRFWAIQQQMAGREATLPFAVAVAIQGDTWMKNREMSDILEKYLN